MSTITQFPSGSTQYRIEFDYLARTFVVVTLVNSSNPTLNRVLEVGRDYRFLNPTMIEMLVDQSGFDIVRIHRQTETDLVVDFRNGSVLTASDLTNAELQAIHIAEEGRDQTVDLAKEYADAAGSSAGNAKDSEDEARRIAESIKASGQIGYITRRSFEKGFNVTTWNEVLLWEEDGGYYRWDGTLPKNVTAGSTPESSGGIGLGAWVSVGDATAISRLASTEDGKGDSLIGVKQPYANTVARTQHDKNSEMISVLDFRQSTDPDWTLAFNRASTISAQLGKTIFVPAGEYEVSDSILLYDLEDVYDEKYYQPPGSRFVGEGRASIIRKTALGTQDVNAVFYNKGKRGNVIRGLSILDETTDSYGYYTPNTAVYQEFSDLFILAQKWGMYFGGNTFVGVSLREIVVQGSDATGIYGGIHIHGGTSYVVSQCNAFKTNYCAFELTGSYCEIGPLAADDCAGIPYIFNAGSYSVSSLGCEQPSRQNKGTIIKGTGANLQIDNLHLYDQTQAAGSYMFDLSGYAKVSIKQLIASSTTTFNGAMARLTTGAKLEIVYSNKFETSWPQRNSYDTKTTTFATLGNLGGVATIPTFSTTMCRDMALPNPDQSAGPYYRIVGGQYGSRGCLGTIYTLRSGPELNPIAGVYNFNTVGSNIDTRAKLVKAAHCDNQSLTDYDAWFTGTYEGTSYLFIRMPTVGGYRNLGTFFSGVVFGQDRNMFKALLASEITGLTPYSAGTILIAQAA